MRLCGPTHVSLPTGTSCRGSVPCLRERQPPITREARSSHSQGQEPPTPRAWDGSPGVCRLCTQVRCSPPTSAVPSISRYPNTSPPQACTRFQQVFPVAAVSRRPTSLHFGRCWTRDSPPSLWLLLCPGSPGTATSAPAGASPLCVWCAPLSSASPRAAGWCVWRHGPSWPGRVSGAQGRPHPRCPWQTPRLLGATQAPAPAARRSALHTNQSSGRTGLRHAQRPRALAPLGKECTQARRSPWDSRSVSPPSQVK